MLKNDLKVLIKASALGTFAIFSYSLYLIVFAIKNIPNLTTSTNNPNPKPVKLFSSDILTTLGVFSMSYFVHSFAVPIFRNSASPQHTSRDLKLSFLLSSFMYSFMGIFGAIAITNLQPSVAKP